MTDAIFTKVVEAHIHNDGEGFDHARIEVDRTGAERILHLADVLKREKVAYIHEYDYSPVMLQTEWGTEDEALKEVDVRTDCEQLVVSNDSFWWEGYVKHCDCAWDTDRITFDELRKAFGIEG